MRTLINYKTAPVIRRYALILTLMLMPVMANADAYYHILGNIYEFKDQSISVSDRFYTYSPTIKVFGLGGQKISRDELKKGDAIKMTIMMLGKKRLVDRIERIPESDLHGELTE